MFKEMKVFLPGPITFVVVLCAFIRIVCMIGHSSAGASNSGGVPTFVTSLRLLMRVLYVDQAGILVP